VRRPSESPLTVHKFKCSEQEKVMEAPISMRRMKKIAIAHSFHSLRSVGVALLTICLLAVSGCTAGSSSSDIKVGPVTFTDANGTALKTSPASLTAGQGTYVVVTLTNDPQLLGADWSVYCGSALPPGTTLPTGETDDSCGTFTPTHTTSCVQSSTTSCIPSYLTSAAGYVALYTAPTAPPKNNTVTLYASATGDHSKVSSVTLTIGANPISVGFAPAPPSTMQAGASTSFRAVLNNDNSNAGVKWTVTCGSADCGSFNPVETTSAESTTYTAPATVPTGGLVVKIAATSVADSSKAATATVTIN
jgi:hypothetical protein